MEERRIKGMRDGKNQEFRAAGMEGFRDSGTFSRLKCSPGRGWDTCRALGRTWTKSSKAFLSLFSSLSCSCLCPIWVGGGAEQFQRIPGAGGSLLFPLEFLDDNHHPLENPFFLGFTGVWGCWEGCSGHSQGRESSGPASSSSSSSILG